MKPSEGTWKVIEVNKPSQEVIDRWWAFLVKATERGLAAGRKPRI